MTSLRPLWQPPVMFGAYGHLLKRSLNRQMLKPVAVAGLPVMTKNPSLKGSSNAFATTLLLLLFVVVARFTYTMTSGVPATFDPSTLIVAVPLLIFGSYFTWFCARPVLSALFNGLGLLLIALSNAWTSTTLIFHTGRHFPLVDQILADIDGWLGFDWVAYLRLFDNNPTFDSICQICYHSVLYEPLPIIVILVITAQEERMYALFVGMIAALVLTTLIALPFPAFGPYEFFGLTAADHPNISPITAGKMTAPITWLRQATFDTPPPLLPVGLISFPSYHSAAAVIYVWGVWRTPVIKWAGLGLNVLMLIATPVHGSHYLIDVIAGIGVAVLCIWVSVHLLYHRRSFPGFRSRSTRLRTTSHEDSPDAEKVARQA
jgi:PAP2 superfamily protein